MAHYPELTMVTIDTEATGLNLYFRLSENSVTVLQLAQYLGFHTPQSVYKWINGKSAPTLHHLVKICGFLGCTPEELIVTVTNGKKDGENNLMHTNAKKKVEQAFLDLDVEQTKINLLHLRKQHRWSRFALSLALGLSSEQSIAKWERNDSTLPTIDHLVLLSELYATPLSDIVAVKAA